MIELEFHTMQRGRHIERETDFLVSLSQLTNSDSGRLVVESTQCKPDHEMHQGTSLRRGHPVPGIRHW